MKRLFSLTLASILILSNSVEAQPHSNQNRAVHSNNGNKQIRTNDKRAMPYRGTPTRVIQYQGRNYPNNRNEDNRPTQTPVHMDFHNDNNQNNHMQNNYRFERGYRAPNQYRQPQYYVNDWQARNLNRPPSGYRWVRNDNNQYLMIAIATGIISQIFASDNDQNYRIWGNGEYLPSQYRNQNYYVNDWRMRGFSRPPSGHRWVHVNHQFLLISINGGRIRAVNVDN